jgi:hypothetical protein
MDYAANRCAAKAPRLRESGRERAAVVSGHDLRAAGWLGRLCCLVSLPADRSVIKLPNTVLRMRGSAILVAEAILPLRG